MYLWLYGFHDHIQMA